MLKWFKYRIKTELLSIAYQPRTVQHHRSTSDSHTRLWHYRNVFRFRFHHHDDTMLHDKQTGN